VKLNDGKKLAIDDDGIKVDDGTGNSLVIDSKGGSMTLQATTKLTLKAPTIAVESSGTLTLKAAATVTIQGAMVNIN
jgi:hypothetical protein